MVALALDGLLALLLLSLGFGVRLHLSLRRLRRSDTEFDQLIGAIDAATDRARTALDGLKQTASDTGAQLAGDVAQAQRLSGDLRFLSDRGERLADRLAEQIERGRTRPSPVRTAAAPNAAPPRSPMPPPDDLERALRTLR